MRGRHGSVRRASRHGARALPGSRRRLASSRAAPGGRARDRSGGVVARGRSDLKSQAAQAALAVLTAEVVTVGNELLSGRTVDTNFAYLARALEAAGARVLRHGSVAD